MSIKKHLATIILWGTLLCVAGCFGATSTHRRYYVLHLDPLRRPENFHIPGVVRVRALDAESAYDRFQIVMRHSPYELDYRERDVWAVKPNHTVSDLIARALLDLRVFSGVTRELGEQRPDYIVSGDLHAIEIYDSGDIWFAHLAITLTLSDFTTGKRLWSFSYQDRKEVPSKTFSHATRALSELLSIAVQLGLDNMASTFAGADDTHRDDSSTPMQTGATPRRSSATITPPSTRQKSQGASHGAPSPIFVPTTPAQSDDSPPP